MNNMRSILRLSLLVLAALITACGGGGGGGGTATNTPLDPLGNVTTYAGDGTAGVLDGPGTTAQFNGPRGVAIDSTNLYVADFANHRIRQINLATGVVSTLAGGTQGFLDGTGTAAQFNGPVGLASDGTNLYVADANNNRIRQVIIATGVVTTLAGDGIAAFLDGTGTAAQFSQPFTIALNGGNLYVADANNHRIRQIVIATGVVTTLAGDGTAASLDGTGTAARFSVPAGITSDGTNLYVTQFGVSDIRQIVIATGVVTTIAGDGTNGFLDGTGTAARFNRPRDLVTDGTTLFIVDTGNHRIRRMVIATGVVTTLAGSGAAGFMDGAGTAAQFSSPFAIAAGSAGLYVADVFNHRVREIR